MNYFRCDVCGKFISYKDLDDGKAVHIMTLPDSEISCETWETLCAIHNICSIKKD